MFCLSNSLKIELDPNSLPIPPSAIASDFDCLSSEGSNLTPIPFACFSACMAVSDGLFRKEGKYSLRFEPYFCNPPKVVPHPKSLAYCFISSSKDNGSLLPI